jgi:uncharacterized protein YbjT (DUF2867 family)
MRSAIVIGATGLTGSHLTQILLKDDRFDKVKVFARRSPGIADPKLEEHLIDFDKPEEWKHLDTGDVLFSAIGTTLKKAGGKVAQYKVDFTYQYTFAKVASENRVPVYVLVSSAGANPDSIIFYTKMKGELEREIRKLPFSHIHIFQPGPLEGEREVERKTEQTGIKVMRFVTDLGIFSRYKPVHGKIVARAMVNASFDTQQPVKVYKLLEVFNRAES